MDWPRRLGRWRGSGRWCRWCGPLSGGPGGRRSSCSGFLRHARHHPPRIRSVLWPATTRDFGRRRPVRVQVLDSFQPSADSLPLLPGSRLDTRVRTHPSVVAFVTTCPSWHLGSRRHV
ncbi:hypothetical protein CU044_2477 [Streptomyces sp. L-9-10]|nr:hypothetical protein CU044_2477 [Streptomyces sp. L-9-10]